MSTTKFDVERFTGENDFSLWRLKIRVVLAQQGVWTYVKSKTDQKEVQEKDPVKLQEMEYKAYSSILLCLNDRVLREVQKEEDAAGVWGNWKRSTWRSRFPIGSPSSRDSSISRFLIRRILQISWKNFENALMILKAWTTLSRMRIRC